MNACTLCLIGDIVYDDDECSIFGLDFICIGRFAGMFLF